MAEIKEKTVDKESFFNYTKARIGNLKLDRNVKVIDGKYLTKNVFDEKKKYLENTIFETSKTVESNTIRNLLQEEETSKINSIMGINKWQKDEFPVILSHTLKFNPYKEFGKLESISGYFNYYHSYSNTLLLVPNIKHDAYPVIDGKTKRINIIDVEGYLKFVKESYEILNYKNGLDIFVPLSLKFGITDIKTIANEYIKNEYFNIWIDFESSSLLEPKIAQIKEFLGVYDDRGYFDKTIIYATNIKREITSHKMDIKTPASDILTAITGANIIGVNRDPLGRASKDKYQGLSSEEKKALQKNEREELIKHKRRIFDPVSYYYYKFESIPSHIDKNIVSASNEHANVSYANAILLDRELKNQTDYFLENSNVKGLIQNKEMIRNYENGKLVKSLFQKDTKTQSSIDDFF